ncbi:hypothetical protein IL306_006289 [Fusarium sp. DS 682]|nr:hypothetical protein IL306_006289 [Fusarium sp. DS 682]
MTSRKRSRPSLNRRKEVEIQDDEPTDDSIRVNQNPEPAQVNGQSEAHLATSKSNSTAAEPNTRLRRSHQLPSRLVHDTPQSTVRRSGESKEHTTATFAPKISQDSHSSTQQQAPPSSQTPAPLPTTASQGAMRPPQQPPIILPKVTTCQSALQPVQRSSSQPSTPRPIAPAGNNKHPAQSSPVNTFTSFNQTAANSSESRMARSVKRQETDDVQSRLSQTSGSLDWNALLVRMIPQSSLFCHNLTTLQPSGNEFKESLKAASTALAPPVKSFEQLLTSINDEHSRLTAVKRSLSSQRDELAEELKKAQEAVEDVEKSIVTDNEIFRDLEDVYNKYPGDKELLTFLEKRKKRSDEHQEVYTIVKSQLDKSSAGLSKTESKIALVTGRLSQLEAERAEVMKEKEGVDKAAKQLMVMFRFMEPGWQATLDMLEQVLGDDALRTAFFGGFHCGE